MNAIKRIMAAVCAALIAVASMAQGMVFAPEGSTLEQASAKAKEEGKLIFLDCYTQWCGPCKMMSRKVFTTDLVGDYMNGRFVNLKIDMETDYGSSLARQLQIQAYPTFILFDADANEIGRFLGSCTAEEFVAKVKEASEDRGGRTLAERWDAGDRSQQFLVDYLSFLTSARKRDDANMVAEALLDGKEATFASDSLLRSVYLRSVANPYAKSFIYTVKHPASLASVVGQAAVDAKTRSVLRSYSDALVVEKDGVFKVEQKCVDNFRALLSDLGISDADHYVLTALIAADEKNGNLDSYMNHIKEYIANPALDADDMQLAKWAKPLASAEATSEQKAQMKSILMARLEDIKSGKRQPMTKLGNMTLSRPTDELLQMIVKALDGKR